MRRLSKVSLYSSTTRRQKSIVSLLAVDLFSDEREVKRLSNF